LLPSLSLPERAVFINNRSSLAHAEFVEDAIRNLVESCRGLEVVVPSASTKSGPIQVLSTPSYLR